MRLAQDKTSPIILAAHFMAYLLRYMHRSSYTCLKNPASKRGAGSFGTSLITFHFAVAAFFAASYCSLKVRYRSDKSPFDVKSQMTSVVKGSYLATPIGRSIKL